MSPLTQSLIRYALTSLAVALISRGKLTQDDQSAFIANGEMIAGGILGMISLFWGTVFHKLQDHRMALLGALPAGADKGQVDALLFQNGFWGGIKNVLNYPATYKPLIRAVPGGDNVEGAIKGDEQKPMDPNDPNFVPTNGQLLAAINFLAEKMEEAVKTINDHERRLAMAELDGQNVTEH